MNWNDSVWLYCERGTTTAFWSEPVNVGSTVFFFLAAFAAFWSYRKLPFVQKSADHRLLIGLLILVGLGSAAFHLFAAQWSELAHMLPLILFVMVFLAFALDRFLELSPGWATMLVGGFVLMTVAGLTMTCSFLDQALQPPWSVIDQEKGGATSCLNGSGGYLPTVLALAILAFFLRRRGHKAASTVVLAAFLFFLSLVFQAIDHLTCKLMIVRGYAMGTHFISHILSALVLYLLLRTSMVHQNMPVVQEILPPGPKKAKRL